MKKLKVLNGQNEELKDIKKLTDLSLPHKDHILHIHNNKMPLQKLIQKDKGKKKIEEEDESEIESDVIPEAEKKVLELLETDEAIARNMQEEWKAEEKETE
ncbi:hypothetical protein Tco_0092978 [Tanacetum coccineum]